MLRRRIDHAWRLGATGFAFAALGIGGFLLAMTIIPLATVLSPDRASRHRRAQRIIQGSFRLYLAMLQRLGVIRLDVRGADRLAGSRGRLVVANHPTLLDVVLVMALVPQAQCVVKHELWRNPFLRPVVKAAGYIRNDQEWEPFIEQCRTRLADGGNLIIFPEGTRSVPGRPLHFQRGFAHIATLLGADLQLVTITCDPITLVKGQAWYTIPERRAHFRVEIDDLLEVGPFLHRRSRPLGARKLVSHLEAYYSGKLA